MNNLIIIGAGGMGRSVYNIAINSIGYNQEFVIKGFIDDNIKSLDAFLGYPIVLNSIDNYKIEANDVFICSIGNVLEKKHAIQRIISKGGNFIQLINNQAIINPNSKIGIGTIISPFAYISADTEIGDFCLIQTFSTIGHDTKIGDWTRVDTHVICAGGVVIGQEVTIHTGAIINQTVIIENKATIGAGSFVIRRVKKGTTVYGNPARKL